MKKIKMNEEALKQVLNEKYEELINGAALPSSTTIQLNPSVKLAENQKVEVWFRRSAYKKMQALIQQCPKEIGWHGVVERTDEKHFQVTDIIMFPQNVTGATVTPDEAEYTQWMIDLALNNEDAFNHMRFHGHSHVNMGVTPSTVDTDYQKNLCQNIEDFYIFGIFNKKDDAWLNIWDIENNILYEREDIKYLYEPDEEDDWAEEQIKRYVKENVYTTTTTAKDKDQDKNKTNPTLAPITNTNNYNYRYDDDWDDYCGWGNYGYYTSKNKNKGKGKSSGYGGYSYD